MIFQRPRGPAAELLKSLKKKKACKRFRVSIRGKGECTRLIIGIGQVHPVLSGRFERFQARRIATVQSEIFSLCRYLSRQYNVMQFGQEGFSGKHLARLNASILSDLKQAASDRRAVTSALRRIASKWRKALHKGRQSDASRYATQLNALALLQALDAGVHIFPIEQARVHGAVGQAIALLQTQLAEVERSTDYKNVQKKQGKGLTKKEYEAAVRRNQIIREYNAVLKHPERDKAILRQVLRVANQDMTVFILGTGHRSNMLTLASRSLPEGTMLAWFTPPSLWWAKAFMQRLSIVLLIIALAFFSSVLA